MFRFDLMFPDLTQPSPSPSLLSEMNAGEWKVLLRMTTPVKQAQSNNYAVSLLWFSYLSDGVPFELDVCTCGQIMLFCRSKFSCVTIFPFLMAWIARGEFYCTS